MALIFLFKEAYFYADVQQVTARCAIRELCGRLACLDAPSLARSEEETPDCWQKNVFCLTNEALDAITRRQLVVVFVADTADQSPPG